MEVKDNVLLKNVFREVYPKVSAHSPAILIKQDTQVFLSQARTPILLVARIVAVSLFIFLAVKATEELVDLFRLRIKLTFVVHIPYQLRMSDAGRAQDYEEPKVSHALVSVTLMSPRSTSQTSTIRPCIWVFFLS